MEARYLHQDSSKAKLGDSRPHGQDFAARPPKDSIKRQMGDELYNKWTLVRDEYAKEWEQTLQSKYQKYWDASRKQEYIEVWQEREQAVQLRKWKEDMNSLSDQNGQPRISDKDLTTEWYTMAEYLYRDDSIEKRKRDDTIAEMMKFLERKRAEFIESEKIFYNSK